MRVYIFAAVEKDKFAFFFVIIQKGKKFNTFRAGIAMLHNMKWNVYDYVMTASALHQSLYGNIKSKQRQRNVLRYTHSTSTSSVQHFPFSGSEIKVMRLLSWAKDSNLIFLFIYFLLLLPFFFIFHRKKGEFLRIKAKVNACSLPWHSYF